MKLLEQIFKTDLVLPELNLRPDPIFIIGMHRSGTSALGGALEPLGLTIGKAAMAPDPLTGNPKGFFENVALTDLHDVFLIAIKSKWWDEKPVRARSFSGEAARQFQTNLPHLLQREFGLARALIKDPRICRLMPLWFPIIENYFPQSRFILPIRHPVQVAFSLHKRDKFPLSLCLNMWVVHVLEGEKNTRAYHRHLIDYEELMAHPADLVEQLASVLDLSTETIATSVSQQIDPGLRHHAGLDWPKGEAHEDLVMAIYKTLLDPKAGRAEKLDALRREYYQRQGWKF